MPASSEELTAWVGTERGKNEPVHIASEGEDLVADLKQGLSYVGSNGRIGEDSYPPSLTRAVQSQSSME